MSELGNLLISNFALIMACMVALWLISIPLKDVSFIDSFWGVGFVLVAANTYLMTGGNGDRSIALITITAVWAARLSTHLFLRWRREGPDGRYVALLKKAPGNRHVHSLKVVFVLQGPMLWIISLPVQLGQIQMNPGLGVLAYTGIGVAIIGIVFETVGDWQLTAFKAQPANQGKVLDRGLWRYTRHPNYFGDACVFWGLFLIAAETSFGRWSLIAPLLLNWILIKWSGAVPLERHVQRSRPDYVDYLQHTSRFFPWPRKKTRA